MKKDLENKKILITGILGQDGANMAEYLLEKYSNVEICGMVRRSSTPNYINIENFKNDKRFRLVEGDLTDEVSIDNLVNNLQPDYFINFGANSFVGCSWNMPLQVFDVNTLGVIRCLEAIRKYQPNCRFYQASSSEEFGDVEYSPQDINHPQKARSPYGASKIASRQIVKVYKESYNLYAVCGILMNHEGTKRSSEFVTRKITKGVAKIAKDLSNGTLLPISIELGNLDAKRDWSDSEDFVDAVWRMLNQEKYNQKFIDEKIGLLPFVAERKKIEDLSKCIDDYVVASGETYSIRQFVEIAFNKAKISGQWVGKGLEEKYIIKENGIPLVEINKKFFRPAEVELLVGDSTPIRKELGWQPQTSFEQLVEKMVKHDLKLEGIKIK